MISEREVEGYSTVHVSVLVSPVVPPLRGDDLVHVGVCEHNP